MSLTRDYVGGIIIAVAMVLFWIFIMPSYDNVLAQRTALQERNDILINRNAILANISALSQQYAKRSADIARFASIVPSEKSAPEIVSSLEALATQNGLQLNTITLSSATNQDTNPYRTQSIDMSLSGTYPAFKSFLLSIEKNIRIIDIVSLYASPSTEDSPIIGFRLKGNAYYLK